MLASESGRSLGTMTDQRKAERVSSEGIVHLLASAKREANLPEAFAARPPRAKREVGEPRRNRTFNPQEKAAPVSIGSGMKRRGVAFSGAFSTILFPTGTAR